MRIAIGRRASRLRTRAVASASGAAMLLVLASPAPAAALDDDRGRPWARRTIRPSFGFGVGLGSYATQLGFSLGASYFVLNGLAVGLSLSDSVLIFKESFKASYPGVHKQVPTNIFRLVPTLQYVFFRSRWFSPYVHAGVGPAFLNNRRGTVGYWVAGPGAFIGIGGPVYLNIGVDFFGMFPVPKCNRAFRYAGSSGDVVQFEGLCAFGWSPNIGIAVAFGGGSKGRHRRKPAPPPDNPLPESTEPVPPPATSPAEPPPPAESPVETPPVEAPPPGETPTETPPTPPPEGPPPPVEGPSPQPPVAIPE